jgi:O-antigen ligase/lipoprotein NlpI
MASGYVPWLRYTLIGGIFLSLIIPFIVANGTLFPNVANVAFWANAFFPFITGKNFIFRILIEILFGVYVLLALREPRYRPRYSPVLGAVLAFVVWVGIAQFFSVDPIKSFWSNFERMEGYITILHLLLYFIITATVLWTERLWNWFFRFSLLASVVMGIYGMAQYLHWIPIDQGGVRLDGTLGNADYFAVYMLFNIFFALYLIWQDWGKTSLRILYFMVLALDAAMLLLSETRGTMLGLVGGLIIATVYVIFAGRHDEGLRLIRKISLWSLGVIAVVVVAFFALRNTPVIRNTPGLARLATISLQDRTTAARFIIWNMAWQGFKEKPIFGWGEENFNYVFNKYYNPVMYDQESWFDRAHDAFLDWLMNAGFLGFLLFISLFVSSAWTIARARQLDVPERAVLLGLLAAFAFHEIFVFDNLVSYLQFFAVLALAHGLAQREVSSSVWLSKPLGEHAIAIAAPIVGVISIGAAFLINGPGIANATGLIKAIETSQTGTIDLSKNINKFNELLKGSPLGRQEVTEQLLQFAIAVNNAQTISPDIKSAFYSTADTAITSLNSERKHDARLELFAGVFLDAFGKYPDAYTNLQQALADSPKKQQILFETGIGNRIPAGDYKTAVDVLKKAYELDTDDVEALNNYAIALYYAGDTAQGDQLLSNHYGTTSPDSDALMQAFFATKQFNRAAAILSNRIAKNPANVQSWAQLAIVYYNAKNTPKAVEILKQAAQANPSYATQFNQLITQLQTGQ